jgi:hypothetical protein
MPAQRTPPHERTPQHDDLRMYLDAIGSSPLLSADEEVALAKQLAHGDSAQRLVEAHGPLRSRSDKRRQALGEGGSRAFRRQTAKAPQLEHEADGLTTHG